MKFLESSAFGFPGSRVQLNESHQLTYWDSQVWCTAQLINIYTISSKQSISYLESFIYT